MSLSKPVRRPRIIISATDAERLEKLALTAGGASDAADLLLDELERADIRPDARVPTNVVRMQSTVEFIDERSQARRTLQLVYPHEADIASGRLSVLSPIGAGLLGLSPGQAILWPDRDGRTRPLRVVSVTSESAEPAPAI